MKATGILYRHGVIQANKRVSKVPPKIPLLESEAAKKCCEEFTFQKLRYFLLELLALPVLLT